MPRTPTYGRAAGPGDAVGSSIYELYAPQRASTEFGVDFARTGYEFQKEVELEKQRQLDAKIAQHEFGEELQKEGAAKTRSKRRKGEKVSSATAWGTAGAKLGSAAGLPGSIVGGIVGGLGGWLFGEEGGMVPAIHPNSLLYKQYQAGGDVTGYSGGQPKFLRRGYQNLQFRQEDVNRAQENLDKMKSYGLWDAVQDVAAGYSAGKSLTPEIKKYSDLLSSTLDVVKDKEKGWGTAWDILTGKATGAGAINIPELTKFELGGIKSDRPNLDELWKQPQSDVSKIIHGEVDPFGGRKGFLEALKPQAKKAMTVMKHQRVKPNIFRSGSAAPARKSTYTRNPFKSKSKPKPVTYETGWHGLPSLLR